MFFSLGLMDWAICLVLLSSSILCGPYLAIRKKSPADSSRFFLAGRSLSWPLVGGSLFATKIGAEHPVGVSGDVYRHGLSAVANAGCARHRIPHFEQAGHGRGSLLQ